MNRSFVIIYVWENIPNKSTVMETIVAVPNHWISTNWKFAAFPPDEFYYPSSKEATTSNPKYDTLVNNDFAEYPISKYAKAAGCKCPSFGTFSAIFSNTHINT